MISSTSSLWILFRGIISMYVLNERINKYQHQLLNRFDEHNKYKNNIIAFFITKYSLWDFFGKYIIKHATGKFMMILAYWSYILFQLRYLKICENHRNIILNNHLLASYIILSSIKTMLKCSHIIQCVYILWFSDINPELRK